jgi:hypothetical protein
MWHSKIEQQRQRFLAYVSVALLLSWMAGYLFGEHLYMNSGARDYYEYARLKWSNGAVNPLLQKSDTFQDVGVIKFSSDTYIDRTHTGCFASRTTYCIAPIVQGLGPASDAVSSAEDAQHRAILPISATGQYSYFAVGKDCCGCPSTTSFSCGDYGYNSGQGGLRAPLDSWV